MDVLPYVGASPIFGTHRIDFTDEDLAIWHEAGGDVATPAAWDDTQECGMFAWFIDLERAYVNEWTCVGKDQAFEYVVKADPGFGVRSACAEYCARPGYGDVVHNAIAS